MSKGLQNLPQERCNIKSVNKKWALIISNNESYRTKISNNGKKEKKKWLAYLRKGHFRKKRNREERAAKNAEENPEVRFLGNEEQ